MDKGYSSPRPCSFFVETFSNHNDGAVQLIVEFRFGREKSTFENFFFVSDEESQVIKHFLTVL